MEEEIWKRNGGGMWKRNGGEMWKRNERGDMEEE